MVKRITGAWADPLAMTIHWLTTDSTLHATVTACIRRIRRRGRGSRR